MSQIDTPPESPPEPAPAPSDKATFDWLIHKKRGWQHGEQGIIEAIIGEIEQDIPLEHRWAVEFGAGDGGKLPLTTDMLVRREGWRSLLIDGSEDNCRKLNKMVPPSALVRNVMVKLAPGDTIDDHMKEATCPSTPAVMVIDIDGMDYHIAMAMKARPYVLCIEQLDTHSPKYNDEPFVPSIEDSGKQYQCDGIEGYFHISANLKALCISVPTLGYTLAAATRLNSIYVRNDMVGKVVRKPDGKLRLNIGCGRYNDPRYVAIDIDPNLGGGIDCRKLPYADNSVDEIYAAHILEHFSFYETENILHEWVRVLKPLGTLRIAVPDAVKVGAEIVRMEADGDTLGVRDMAMIACGAHTDPTNVHHNIFTESTLRDYMNRAGIGMVGRFEPFIDGDCANHPVSLNLEGVKRWWPKVEKPSVTFIMNQPRFAFTGHEQSMLELARKCDFQIQPCMGAFWERDNNVAVIEAIRKTDPDFLVWSDYDSKFEADDYFMLLEAIQNDPQMAAIGAVQMSRHNDQPLVFEKRIDYAGDICRVDFQHFGLTIIRREALEELNLTLNGPLFWSIPGKDKNGKWDWDQWSRSDGDITFWRNMRKLGFKVCQHNKVCIGHIVQCIKYPWPRGSGNILWPIENYMNHGKPKGVGFNADLFKNKMEPIRAPKADPPKEATP
jgi:SAM-dependent methyltransferase